MIPAKVNVAFRHAPTANGGLALWLDETKLVEFAACGESAMAGENAFSDFAASDILRWCAPFAFASRDITVLHAACVAQNGTALAIMGPGGAGKTTLASQCVEAGWDHVSSDALICGSNRRILFDAEGKLRDWCAAAASQFQQTRRVHFGDLLTQMGSLLANPAASATLDFIAFLALPRSPREAFGTATLNAVDAFHALVQHGFGTLPGHTTWRNEAAVYASLATALRASRVHAPDGLTKMERALPGWLETLATPRAVDAAMRTADAQRQRAPFDDGD